jgi:hypothetical protein
MKKILIPLVLSSAAFAIPCPEKLIEYNEYNNKRVYTCLDESLVEHREYNSRTKKLVSYGRYGEFGKVESKSWSAEGRFTYHAKYNYLNRNSYIKEVINIETKKLQSKEQYDLIDNDFILSKEWVIHRESLKVQALNHYLPGDINPYRIDHLSKNGDLIKSFLVKFKKDLEFAKYVTSFDVLSKNGELLGSYHESKKIDIAALLKERGEFQFYKVSKEPVVIIDTGFDITHKRLTKYLFNSPYDIPNDGIDNDENGRVDDSHGWHMQEDSGLDLDRDDNNIRETHFLTHTPFPVSHGTHVAAKAFEGTSKFGLVGFAGDVAIAKHLQGANDYIKSKKVRFVNMSFAIGFPGVPMSAPRESFEYLEKIFLDNPSTLFTVAAGNGRSGLNLDLPGNQNFPASHSFENMIVVGALNTSDYDRSKMNTYKRASFSKYGKINVDIFAPGKGVVSAHSGGGVLALNGTSMASPFALNILLKASEINPNLSPLELKEIVMKTAFIPTPRLHCVSGGMIDPIKVYKAAELSKKYSIAESIKKSLSN